LLDRVVLLALHHEEVYLVGALCIGVAGHDHIQFCGYLVQVLYGLFLHIIENLYKFVHVVSQVLSMLFNRHFPRVYVVDEGLQGIFHEDVVIVGAGSHADLMYIIVVITSTEG
jgi:hypothetical protein